MRRILPRSLRTRVLVALFVLACLLLSTARPPAHAAPAAIRTVGAGCTYTSLQAAVNAAASGDEIRMEGATGFNGQTVISNKNLTISGGWADNCTTKVTDRTVLNGVNAGSVLKISGNVTVLLTDLVIINGADDADDGGIEIDNATVTLANVYVNSNVSDYGGGIHLNGGNLLLTNGTRIFGNTANQSGGGIYATGSGTVTLQTGTIVGTTGVNASNSASSGGGIFVANAGLTTMLVTLNGTAAVSDNHATGLVGLGGGIYMQGGRLNMTSAALISDNSAYSGGGIQANNGAQVVVAGTLRNNSALGRGGGISVSGATTALQLNAPTIAANSAGLEGGGIASNATPVTFTGGTLGGMLAEDGNTAGTNGGGLYCVSAQCVLTDVLVSQNSAASGGGLYQSGNALNVSGTSRVRANHASGNGGGIAGANNASIAVFGSAEIGGALPADGNTVGNTGMGGGIYSNSFPAGYVLVAGAALVGHNSAWRGGGVALDEGSAAFAGNARIHNNSASDSGGGIFGNGPGIALSGNAALAANAATVSGGGIYITSGTLDLTNIAQIGGSSAAEGNHAGQFGGGIWANATEVELGDNTAVRFNHADQHGGGIALQGSATITTTAGQISYNSAAGNGGGIYAHGASEEIRLTNTALSHNSAAEGGGIYSAGLIDLKSTADGPAGCNAQLLPQNMYCAELRANTTTGSGAAIYGYDSANLRLSGVALLDHATGLATVYLNGAGVTATLNDTLFADNPAGGYRSLLGGSHSWSNLTFAHNGSQPFVLAGNGGTLNVTNTIVWGNTLNGSTGTYVVSGGCNRSQGIVLPGFGGNPQFHTSPRGDYRLSSASPAVDACAGGTAVDLDGTPRPQLVDGPQQFDQGAFELVQVPTAVTLRGAAADLTNLADLSNLVGVALLLGLVTLLRRRFDKS